VYTIFSLLKSHYHNRQYLSATPRLKKHQNWNIFLFSHTNSYAKGIFSWNKRWSDFTPLNYQTWHLLAK